MRRLRSILSLAAALSLSWAAALVSGMDTADDNPVDLCFAAFQRTFKVPASKISSLAQSGLPIEEMPVLFFAAGRLQVDPSLVLQRRLRGRRWQAVLDSYGIGPSVFYAPIDSVETKLEPFRRLRGLKSEEWDRAFLSDRELVELANMRFVVEAYGALPATFIEMRSSKMSHVEVIAWFEVERQDFLDRREDQRRWEDEQRQRRKDDDSGDRQRELRQLDQDNDDRRLEYQQLDQEAYDKRREQQRLDQEAYDKRREQQRLDEEEYQKRQEEQRRRDEEYRKSHPS